jgi:hypothetical protein
MVTHLFGSVYKQQMMVGECGRGSCSIHGSQEAKREGKGPESHDPL